MFDAPLTLLATVLAVATLLASLVFGIGAAFSALTLPEASAPSAYRASAAKFREFEVQIGEGRAWFIPHEAADRTVVLVHGHNRARTWWRPIIEALRPDVAILAIDLPAHGTQWPGLCRFGESEWRYVEQALTWLQGQGPTKVTLVGHSMGGSTSINALALGMHEGVDGLVTIGSYGAIRDVYAEIATRNHAPQGYVLGALRLAAAWTGFSLDQAPIDRISDVDVPYLAIHGRDDSLVPPAQAEELVGAAQDGQLYWYDGDHDEPDNPVISDALRSFIWGSPFGEPGE